VTIREYSWSGRSLSTFQKNPCYISPMRIMYRTFQNRPLRLARGRPDATLAHPSRRNPMKAGRMGEGLGVRALSAVSLRAPTQNPKLKT